MRLKKRTFDLGKHGGCTCIFIPRPVFCGHLPARLRNYSMQQHVLKAEDGEVCYQDVGSRRAVLA